MIRPLLLCLLIAPSVHARGDFDFTFGGTGGTASFSPSASPTSSNAPILKFGANGQPYLSGGRAISLPGARGPITLALKAPITRAGAGAALANLAKFTTPIGSALTIASLIYALQQDGYTGVSRTEDGWDATRLSEGKDCAPVTNPQQYCSSNHKPVVIFYKSYDEGYCAWTINCTYIGNNPNPRSLDYQTAALTDKVSTYIPQRVKLDLDHLANAIAKDSGWPTTKDLTDALNHPLVNFDPMTAPSVSGVPQTEGIPTTETVRNPDGTTTTTTKTPVININYTGPVVTTTTTTTTTTTNTAPNGNNISTDTKTDTTAPEDVKPPPDKESGLCALFPEILACKTLEEPAEEAIPKETKNIEMQEGPQFGGAGCLPDVTVPVFGRQLTVLSMSTPCGWISDFLKPLFLLMASISAVFILMPKD